MLPEQHLDAEKLSNQSRKLELFEVLENLSGFAGWVIAAQEMEQFPLLIRVEVWFESFF
jgi:hypothetical protein